MVTLYALDNMITAETKSVLVTGANGFVGRPLCEELLRHGRHVTAAARSPCQLPSNVKSVIVGPIDGETNWFDVLRDVDIVIHLAARVHVMRDTVANPLEEFLRINLHGTENLARQAARAGVKRLVYVSSIKVNGERTTLPFKESDDPNPQDPYGVSKCEAELALHRVAAETGLEIVIVRPPLVYGAGVKGNFAQLIKVLVKGIPLPLASVHNLRSFVALDNLVDLIVTCIDHPAAANQTFLAGDGEDLSTAELLRRMGKALGKPAKLFSVPTWILRTVATLLGKGDMAQRLCDSLQVDISKAFDLLGWRPPVSVDDALKKMAIDFMEKK